MEIRTQYDDNGIQVLVIELKNFEEALELLYREDSDALFPLKLTTHQILRPNRSQTILDDSIYDMDLSSRANTRLMKYFFTAWRVSKFARFKEPTVRDLVQIKTQDLNKIKGLGKKTLNEIRFRLLGYDLKLGMTAREVDSWEAED